MEMWSIHLLILKIPMHCNGMLFIAGLNVNTRHHSDAFWNVGNGYYSARVKYISISLAFVSLHRKRVRKWCHFNMQMAAANSIRIEKAWIDIYPHLQYELECVTFSLMQLLRLNRVSVAAFWVAFQNVCTTITRLYYANGGNKEIWTEHVCSNVFCTCKCLTEYH